MKKFHLTRPALTFVTLLLLLITACCQKEKAKTCIAYSVTCYTDKPYKLCIIYQDSSERKEIYVESNWTKEICLPSNVRPSLIVFMYYQNEIDEITENDDFITAKIIHSTRTETYSSKSVAVVRW